MLKEAINALEHRGQQRVIADERFVREHEILDELAPRLWNEVRQALRTNCSLYPQHFTFEVTPTTHAQVRASTRKVLMVEYLKASKRISYECGGVGGDCSVRLDEDGKAALYDAEGHLIPTAAYLAESLLTAALR